MITKPHAARFLAALSVIALITSACSANKTKKSNKAVCPEGTWMIVGDQIRNLLGADIGPNAKTTDVSGTITLRITSSGATTYEFGDVILAGTSDGGPKRVGVQGSLIGESAFTMNGMSTNVVANSLRFSLDGLPADTSFTTFASTNLERSLTGAATYACGPSTLTINDASTQSTLVWSAA